MALRSVLRKMPALGLRSPPVGPLMGLARALSPAASSRLMSSLGAPEGQAIQSEASLAEQLESINLRRAEIGTKWSEHHAESGRKWAELLRRSEEQERRAAQEFENAMEMHRQDMASDEAHYIEAERRYIEDLSRLMKKVRVAEKTCNVLDAAWVSAAVVLMINLNM